MGNIEDELRPTNKQISASEEEAFTRSVGRHLRQERARERTRLAGKGRSKILVAIANSEAYHLTPSSWFSEMFSKWLDAKTAALPHGP